MWRRFEHDFTAGAQQRHQGQEEGSGTTLHDACASSRCALLARCSMCLAVLLHHATLLRICLRMQSPINTNISLSIGAESCSHGCAGAEAGHCYQQGSNSHSSARCILLNRLCDVTIFARQPVVRSYCSMLNELKRHQTSGIGVGGRERVCGRTSVLSAQ